MANFTPVSALVGHCPGPAVASLGFANAEALWLVPVIVAGRTGSTGSTGEGRRGT